MLDLDEQLELQAEEEERRRLELDELSQRERLEGLQDGDNEQVGEEFSHHQQSPNRVKELKDQTKEKAEKAAKEGAEKAVKQVGKKAAQEAATSVVAATSEIWVPAIVIIGIIVIIVAFVGLAFTSFVAACNDTSLKAKGLRFFAFLGTAGASSNVCKQLGFDNFTGGGSGGAGGGASWEPGDLVSLVGRVAVDASTSDPRVRECLATRLEQMFNDANRAGLRITITSAYRAGGLTAGGGTSAHSRGEAVDIALRDPVAPLYGNDPRIDQLVDIARSAGFVPPEGDTLDEYRNPAPNATGGHVHVEFNIPTGDGSYCAPLP